MNYTLLLILQSMRVQVAHLAHDKGFWSDMCGKSVDV